MDLTPYVVLYVIAAVAVVVWLCGLLFLLNTKRTAAAQEFWDDEADVPIEPSEAMVRGAVEVAGQPARLSAKAAAHLAQHGVATLGLVKIVGQTDTRVAFEAVPQMGGRFVRHGIFEFHSLGTDRTRIDYAILVPKRPSLLVAAWTIQIIALLALVIGFVGLYVWVAPHPEPAVHWQTFQMGQIVHFLWLPFLFAGVYRRVQTHVRNVVDSLVHNLPYVQG